MYHINKVFIMKTNQKLVIDFKGIIFEQDMKTSMIYTNALELAIIQHTKIMTKTFNSFYRTKDTKDFVKKLMDIENITEKQVIFGRGRTLRVHHLLAFKFTTWASKEFEIKVYKFFLENYPLMRELGGDRYNEFVRKYLPTVYTGNNGKWVVINLNMYINKILQKTNGWNKESRNAYEARMFIFNHLNMDIYMKNKPKARQKIGDWLQERADYYLEAYNMQN